MNNWKGGRTVKGNTILCLIDFSEASQRSLRWASSMALKLNAHLTILYSYRLLESNVKALQMKKQAEVDALQKFLKWEQEVLAHDQIEYEFRSEVGFMADRVEDYISKNPVSLVIIHKPMMHDHKETVQHLVDQLIAPLVIVP